MLLRTGNVGVSTVACTRSNDDSDSNSEKYRRVRKSAISLRFSKKLPGWNTGKTISAAQFFLAINFIFLETFRHPTYFQSVSPSSVPLVARRHRTKYHN